MTRASTAAAELVPPNPSFSTAICLSICDWLTAPVPPLVMTTNLTGTSSCGTVSASRAQKLSKGQTAVVHELRNEGRHQT